MTHTKGDVIDGYEVALPLKGSDTVETYRVRDAHRRLLVMKTGCTDNEASAARLTPLFVAQGDVADRGGHYVVYRHLSGETLEARLLREGCLSVEEAKRIAADIALQVADLHEKGLYHSNLKADNVMIDLSSGEPQAWLTGFSHVSASASPDADIAAVGRLLWLMIFGEQPATPPRMRNRDLPGLDERMVNTMYKALTHDFASARQMADALEGKMEVKRSLKPTGPGFAAVAGMNDIKRRLQEDVIDILADRDSARAYGIEIPNGMLLYGPPGCGKTFIAEKFAEQAAYSYEYVKSSDLASTYIHGSQEKIRAMFDKARKNAPTILCFDEFDALVPRRDEVHNASQSGEVNEFLSQLNNCGKDGVFVIATTNRPEGIDPAVLRTGRMDYMLYVPLPDHEARQELFNIMLKNRPVGESVDSSELADLTDGYIASDITAIVNEAARKAFHAKEPITMSLLKDAVAHRKPSLTKKLIKDYEQMRQRFEHNANEERRRVGF